MSGLVLLSMMCLTTVTALQTEPSMVPSGVIIMTDSECTISTLDTSTRALHPFMHKSVGDIQENNAKMKKFCDVKEVYHVAGADNPADLHTRGLHKISETGPYSFWQIYSSLIF